MKLKVCGMKYNIEEVAALQPDFLGFIFWEPSSRYFNQGSSDHPIQSKKVGVFVDSPIEDIILQIYEHELDAIQLHGQEDPIYCTRLKDIFSENSISNIELIKAFAVNETFDFEGLVPYEPVCDYFLFDTRGELPGGTGRRFDWSLLKKYSSGKPFFLSGGIGPGDAAEIKKFLERAEAQNCYAIDINSRFEKKPGLKDIDVLNKFIEEIGFRSSKN